MSFKLVIELAAVEDVRGAYAWYFDQEPQVAMRFRVALNEALTRAQSDPLAYQELYRGARRVLLGQFPYAVYFHFMDDTVVVIAVMHLRRQPTQWRSRV